MQAIAGIFSVIVVVASFGYIRSNFMLSKKQRQHHGEAKFIRSNPHIFAVKNNGVSLDKREIYSLTLEELGLY